MSHRPFIGLLRGYKLVAVDDCHVCGTKDAVGEYRAASSSVRACSVCVRLWNPGIDMIEAIELLGEVAVAVSDALEGA